MTISVCYLLTYDLLSFKLSGQVYYDYLVGSVNLSCGEFRTLHARIKVLMIPIRFEGR